MVCKLHARPSGFRVPVYCTTNAKTHNDRPANVKTYDFILMVSFRGHSQYLATWAKMMPWQMDCKMPSIRMGALIGTSVCAASDEGDIMGRWGVNVGRRVSLLLRLLINAPSPVLVETTRLGRPARDEMQRGPRPSPNPGLESRPKAVSHARAEKLQL